MASNNFYKIQSVNAECCKITHLLTMKANFSGSFSSKIAKSNKQLVNLWALIYGYLDAKHTSVVHMALWKLNMTQKKMGLGSLFGTDHTVQDERSERKLLKVFLEKRKKKLFIPSFSQLRQYILPVQSSFTHRYAWISPMMDHIQTFDAHYTEAHTALSSNNASPCDNASFFLWLTACHLSSLRHVTQITCRLQNVIQIPCEDKSLN